MTENKRFTWLKKDVYAPQIVITDSLTEKDLTPTDCYELLNELADDNEQLKQEVDFYKDFQKDARELEKENEQLKQAVKCHEERIAILVQLLDLADTIIDLGDDESAKEFWEKMNDNMDSKWGELIKKAKRDYTSGGIYYD